MPFNIITKPDALYKKTGIIYICRFIAYYTRFTAYFLFLATLILSFRTFAFAGDEPFTYPSNWGSTGLMEIPTARVIRENHYRMGISQTDPYRIFYITVSPLRRLEVTGRVTEVLDTPSGLVNQINFKDKAVDLKYQFFSEDKYMPALSVGIMDPHGTRVYPSQYLVASKQAYPFDFTLGFGNGRFGKNPLFSTTDGVQVEIISSPRQWLSDSQLFWGIQFAPHKKFALIFEHSPIQYHKQTRDPAQSIHFTEEVPSEYNFGIRIKPTSWTEVDLSYQRGNQVGINLSMAFDIGNPIIPIYDHSYRELQSDILDNPSDRIIRILKNSGFSDIGVNISGNTLWIEAQNDKYLYAPRAIQVIVRILPDIAPEWISDIHIILKETGIPVIQFTTTRNDIIDLYAEKMTPNEFIQLSNFSTGIKDTLHARGRHKKFIGYGLKPEFQTFLNDPSGFFKYKLGVKGWIKYHPWKGSSFITGLTGYALNNISTSNEPLSKPVRSDIVLYEKEKIALDRLMFTQVKTLLPSLYGSISAGLLELQYAGVDGEIAMPVLNGRIYLGISGSAVKKRSPDNPLELQNNPVQNLFTTTFLKTRINIPEKEIAIDIKAGEFLAGDRGVRYEISKNIKGVTLRAWYTSTDTSIFSDTYNRGYHDKGIGISLPLRLFIGTDSKTVFKYLLSPWTRDTGQDIDHFNTLFDFIGRNSKIYLDKDQHIIYN